jgi:copper chaperone NosL
MRIGLVLTFSSLASCRHNTVPIDYENDSCAYCRMMITDKRFGAELITKKGKIYKFDSIECLTAHVAQKTEDASAIESLWTIDFTRPGEWVHCEDAAYLHSRNLPSPMGAFLSSFQNKGELNAIKLKYEGENLDWSQVQVLVKNEWLKN